MSSGCDWQNCWRATLSWNGSGCGVAFLLTVPSLSWFHVQLLYIFIKSLDFWFTYHNISGCFFYLLCLSFLIWRALDHFCFPWPYLNVILKPLTLNLLSPELQYSLLIQITPNPPIDAVSRNLQAVSPKKSLGWKIQQMYVHVTGRVCNSHSGL